MDHRHISRREGLIGGAMLASGLIAARPTTAQPAYPTRPVRFVIGLPAGGASDSVARLLSAELSKVLGQQVVVENKPGASGNIATQSLLGAPADGHTIYLAQINLATTRRSWMSATIRKRI